LDETRDMLERLSRLWAEIEDITARSSFRFDATRAYYDLVQRRASRPWHAGWRAPATC